MANSSAKRFTHHLYIVFFGMYIFHSFGCFFRSSITNQCRAYNSQYYLVPLLILFFIEKDLRIWRSRKAIEISSAIFHPGNTLELRFEKPDMKYLPGQYLFLCVPMLSGVQWHPFTISSAPDEGFVSVHIKQIGDWTKGLGKLLLDCERDPMAQFPHILVDGPYGAPAQDIFKFETSAMISAGIGVTPAASLLKAVFFNFRSGAPMRLKKMHFIWIARDKQDFEWFQALLGTLEKSIPRNFLEMHIYLTGKLDIDDIQNIVLNDSLEGGVDPITELSTRCHYGRPHWDRIFPAFKESQLKTSKKTRMGVFYCGPHPLAVKLNEACIKHSDSMFDFEFRKEHF